MDFFDAQARARKRTSRLVVLFVLAVLGTVVAGYFATVALLGFQQPANQPFSWWDPVVLASVSSATVLIVGLSSLLKWSELSRGGASVAKSVGGRRIDPGTADVRERRLLNVVEEMAIASGVPMPAVYSLPDEPGINAFAAGLTTSDAVVAVTQGALTTLTRDELQGVIAHEFSHILNGDMRLNVRLTATIFGILVLGLIGRGILTSLRHTRSRGKNQGGVLAALLAAGLVLMLLGYVGYFFGRLIQAAVSRQREFLADASAVQFTRNPDGIGNALKRIAGFLAGSRLASAQSAQFSHFFFAQSFRTSLAGLWATHPPLATRIQKIDAHFDPRSSSVPAAAAVVPPPTVAAAAAEPPEPPFPRFAPPAPPPVRIAPQQVIAAIGTVDQRHVANAHALLAELPGPLREAARSPTAGTALIYGLLLGAESEVRANQFTLLRRLAGNSTAAAVAALHDPLVNVSAAARLPLAMLTLPALHTLGADELAAFLGTLDKLIRIDGNVSLHEFALQKVLTHHLARGKSPADRTRAATAFTTVSADIVCVLGALATAAAPDTAGALQAFSRGAAQLPMLAELARATPPHLDFDTLGRALDRLALSSYPIRQRVLVAGVHVILADGEVQVPELDLLRAFASVLECPLPALTA